MRYFDVNRSLAGTVLIWCLALCPAWQQAGGQDSAVAAGAKTNPGAQLAFTAGEKGEYHFDTGVLRGTLRPDGKTLGLSALVHIPTGQSVSRFNGLFSHYRVFTTNFRHGEGAWGWPSVAMGLADGAVEVRWGAVEGRPFEMRAVYRWSDPTTLELETTVKAQADLPHFEVFLASYFNEAFTNAFAYVKESPEAARQPGLMAAKKPLGDWQMFPRDSEASALIKDGRWKIQPSPVDWVIMPTLAAPLALRREIGTGLAAVVMAPPADCYAVGMPHQTEGHYSLYLALFGRDLKAGTTARARSRLWIAVAPTDAQVVQAYRGYVESLSK